jgi:FPC/CPF motif-containing protein YcgG
MQFNTQPALSRASTSHAGSAEAEFRQYINAKSFPCVGAKSASNRGQLSCAVLPELGTRDSAERLHVQLREFSDQHEAPGLEPVSFAAIFMREAGDEIRFHELLWRQLQLLHDVDNTKFDWAPEVSSDPAAQDFSFSVAGRAFFVVGLHPRSARLARRSPRPTLVFNFHDQFEALKAAGRYQKMQRAIRERDVALQGDINPTLADFGNGSEARQYSGHHGGVCPFHAGGKVA